MKNKDNKNWIAHPAREANFGNKLGANHGEITNSKTWVFCRMDSFSLYVSNLLKTVNNLGDFPGSLNTFFQVATS